MQDLEKSHSSLLHLVNALQVKDEDEASIIFQRLRRGSSVKGAVNYLQAGDALLQVHLAPETSVKFEFPYRTQLPTALFTSSNPYLSSMMYGSISSMPEVSSVSREPSNSSDDSPYGTPYLKPYGVAVIVDSRLDNVTPSQWTSVLAEDSFMRMLLEQYFRYEHHFFSCFQKDLFLDDMVSGATTFCSELLVNAVLALACVRILARFQQCQFG
jgi:hypothetical protein